jgi:hypothetical protein
VPKASTEARAKKPQPNLSHPGFPVWRSISGASPCEG